MSLLSSIYWDYSPDLVNLGPITIRWYGMIFALGFFLGYLIMLRIFRREDKPENDLGTLLLYIMGGTLIGARLGHCFFYEPAYYLSRPGEIIQIWHGGLASHGGAIGIVIAIYLYSRKRTGQSFLWLLDRIVIPVALAGALIRVGNLFNSEIIGTPSRVPWAFVFPRAIGGDLLLRHPTMLYEAASYFLIFILLLLIYKKQGKKSPPGELLGLFLITVFTSRFFIEFVKMRQAAYHLSIPLNTGQLLSIPAIIAGIILLIRSRPDSHRDASKNRT